jgi:hypothetical protein
MAQWFLDTLSNAPPQLTSSEQARIGAGPRDLERETYDALFIGILSR